LGRLERTGVHVWFAPEGAARQAVALLVPEPQRRHRVLERGREATQEIGDALLEGLPVAERLADRIVRAQLALGHPLERDVLRAADPPQGLSSFHAPTRED